MCLIVLIGAALPRFALFLTWLLSDRISRAIDNTPVALLGFIFLPFTTFFYVAAWAPVTHVSGLGWLLVALGLVFDLGSYGGGGQSARSRGTQRSGLPS